MRSWAAWAAGAVFFFYGFVHRVAPSVMVDDLMRDFGVSAAALGNLSANYFYAYAATLIPAGVVLDRFGPRRAMTAASAALVAGSLLFVLADGLVAASLGRLLIGSGCAFAMLGTIKIAAIWFPPGRFALLFGLTALVGLGGAFFGQAPLAFMVKATDWRTTLIGLSLLGFAVVPALWLAVRDGARAPGPREPVFAGLRSVLAVRQTWLAGLVNAGLIAPLLSFGGLWGVPFIQAVHGVDRTTAAAVASSCLLGHGVGGSIVGWLSDRVGVRKPVILACGALAVAGLALVILVPGVPLWGTVVGFVAFGFGSGTSAVIYATAREENGTGLVGTTSAAVNTLTMGISAVFQPFIGWLLDGMATVPGVFAAADYRLSCSSFVVSAGLAFAVALMLRETFCAPRDERDRSVGR